VGRKLETYSMGCSAKGGELIPRDNWESRRGMETLGTPGVNPMVYSCSCYPTMLLLRSPIRVTLIIYVPLYASMSLFPRTCLRACLHRARCDAARVCTRSFLRLVQYNRHFTQIAAAPAIVRSMMNDRLSCCPLARLPRRDINFTPRRRTLEICMSYGAILIFPELTRRHRAKVIPQAHSKESQSPANATCYKPLLRN